MDLRDYLEGLDRDGMLTTVDAEVDWNLEAACTTAMLQRVSQGKHYALFNNVKGYYPDRGRIVSIPRMHNRRKYWEVPARILGLPPDISREDFRDEYQRRITTAIKPIEVSPEDAPCKEVIKMGKDANLLDFPIPLVHGADGGRYLTDHWVINQDPDTGWTNVGIYRWMVKGPRRGAALWTPHQHGPSIHYNKYEARGKACPVVIAIGGDPCASYAMANAFPAGVCEYDYVGGLRGEPLELVRAETSNLLVPARAEIIIECEIRPGETTDEGPFGEITGFTHGRNLSPVFRVNCITYRKNPIIPLFVSGCKWAATAQGVSINHGPETYSYLKPLGLKLGDAAGDTDALTSFVAYTHDPQSPQELTRFINAVVASKGHFIYTNSLVLDTDVDVEDARDRWEEVGLNCNPLTFHKYQFGDSFMYALHFFTDVENRFRNTDGGKCVFDCTTKFKNHDFVDRKDHFEKAFPEGVRNRTKELWSKLGFDQPWEQKEQFSPYIP
jgi:UbiD family decarboxylase